MFVPSASCGPNYQTPEDLDDADDYKLTTTLDKVTLRRNNLWDLFQNFYNLANSDGLSFISQCESTQSSIKL